jgi:hypothetical protein
MDKYIYEQNSTNLVEHSFQLWHSYQDQITDWFDSLAECLHWNVRKKQKHLDELSDLSGDGLK